MIALFGNSTKQEKDMLQCLLVLAHNPFQSNCMYRYQYNNNIVAQQNFVTIFAKLPV